MAKITDCDLLVVGTEITIDTTAKTFTLNQAGNLIYKDGVTLQAVYSKFIKLWETSAYNKYPFPMYVIDAKSGQFQFGTDGGSYNGWKPADDKTRQALRDGGWSEYDNSGNLNRQHVGIVALGTVNTGAQLYYQKVQGGAPANFTFTDEVNEGIQVFGDANNGNFDNRTYFKAFTREYGKKYKSSTLADTAQSGTGAYTVNVLISNEDDTKIQAPDSSMSAAPYDNITVTYYNTDQNEAIGSGSYPFRVIIDGNGATLEQIYTKAQYLLRQTTDIDAGSGTVIGKTADELCYFLGDTLITTPGVFIINIQANDVNRIQFTDYNGVPRTYPYSSAGIITFNTPLATGGAGYYIMYFLDTVTGDYGTSTAIIVNNKDGVPIQGTITGSSIPFTFDYDGNTQGGRTAGTDAPIVIVAGNKGYAKPVVVKGTINRAKGVSFGAVAETDRAYIG
jgi:hypothetical protein